MSRAWAPGGTLQKPEDLDAVKGNGKGFDLSLRHMQRIVKGEHWREGWKPKRLPDEYKTCEVCGELYGRRVEHGRLRNPHVWARMVTCSLSCKLKRQWATGDFANRRKA